MFNITSFREGFATNSSSMHSVILTDKMPSSVDEWDTHGEYGWSNFLLLDRDEKRKYMATQFRNLLPDDLPGGHDEQAAAKDLLVKHYLGWEPGEYVDHNSQVYPPKDFGESTISVDCFREYANYVCNSENIAVYGGNDNDDNKDRSVVDAFADDMTPWGSAYGETYARKDRENWVAFSADNGRKVRWNYTGGTYTYSGTPELVDIKITDYCSYGCKFCYQDSTEHGVHADYWDIRNLAWAMRSAKVFEVAIGGGEPTSHPRFIDILGDFRRKGIVPNFTTFNLDWISDEYICNAVNSHCGGFAVSSIAAKVLDRVKRWKDGKNKAKVTIQIPCGAYPKKAVNRALEFCAENYVPVTLLGYKTTGRGKEVDPKDYGWLWQRCLELREKHRWGFQVGVDTLFAKQFADEIDAAGIDNRLVVGEEGHFSCYIDAVEKKIAAHSYMDKDQMEDFDTKKPFKNFPYLGAEAIR